MYWRLKFNFGQIAQLVERRTENPCVPGSIPGLATILARETLKTFASFFCICSTAFNDGRV